MALRDIQKSITELDRRDILDWLDALKYDDEHEKHLSSHVDGTCKWILTHPAYLSWEANGSTDAAAKFLWIHGPAGFGKTMISAWLIQHIEKTLRPPIAHCFSSSHARRVDDLDGIIRSWITQLTQCNDKVLDLCQRERRKQWARRASSSTVWKLLREISAHIPSCVFVLDGLDEFSGANDARSRFLKDMKRAVTLARVKVLITSRDEVDIESELSASNVHQPDCMILNCKLSIDNVKDDNFLYAQSMMDQRFPTQDRQFRRDLSAQLVDGADGMFLWIKLQQCQLRSTQNKKTIQRIIQGAPHGLDKTYERNWNSILEAGQPDRDRAINILRWLTFGFRTLTVQELAEALIVELNEDYEAICEEDVPTKIDVEYINNEIKGICRSLVEVRVESHHCNLRLSTVHLVHASVREYLTKTLPIPVIVNSTPKYASPSGTHHACLAAYCLRYLNCAQAWRESRCKDSSFTDYAANAWFKHLRECEEFYDSVSSLVHGFMKPGSMHFNEWRQIHDIFYDYGHDDDDLYFSTPNQYTSTNACIMYYACLLGLLPTMNFLHENRGAGIDSVAGNFGTPLQAACFTGDQRVFDRLISWGANVAVRGGPHRYAINAAAYYGRHGMMKALLECEAEIVPSTSRLLQATRVAVGRGHLEVVALLLQQITVVSPSGSSCGSYSAFLSKMLLRAAEYGHPAVVKLLLERGTDVLACDDVERSSLHLASANGHLEVAKVILQYKPLFNRHKSDSSPSHPLTVNDDFRMSAELLAKRESYGRTPLHEAARYGHAEIVEFLVAHGADVNAQDEAGDTPLHVSASTNDLETTIKLLISGADLRNQACDGWTALHISALQGHEQQAKLLLDKGHPINARNNEGETPLIVAISCNNIEIAELLILHGADPKIPDERGMTPLHWAVYKGRLEHVRRLIAHGCNINTKTKTRDTPVHDAIVGGASDGLVNELIQSGADLSVSDQYGMSCLDWLRRLRPHLLASQQCCQALESVAFGPDLAILERNASELAARIRKEPQEQLDDVYYLFRSLLLLNMEGDARLAYQASSLAKESGPIGVIKCDGCNTFQNRDDPFYPCKTCPNTDLCHECMIKHRKQPLLERCRDHDFLRIVASEASVRLDQTKVFEDWLLSIEERFKPANVDLLTN